MTERTLVYMDVGDLLSRFHPQNPKLHSVDELRRSMARFGYAESVILDERTGLLAAGHGRVEVLSADEKAGAKPPEGIAVADGKWQVPVQRGWASKNDSEARAYLIASNRLVETGGWDDGGLAAMLQSISETDLGLAGIGYDDAQLADLLAGLREPSPKNPDAVPPVPKTPVTKLGDVWLLGDHRVMCGDATEFLPNIDSGSIGLVATDPPYFRTVDAEWDDQWGPDVEAFLKWIAALLPEFNRVLVDRGTVGVFCSPDLSAGIELEMRRVFAILNHIVWRKPTPGRLGRMDKSAMRRFFPTSERFVIAEKSRNPDGDLFRFRDHVNHSVARDVYADVRQMLVEARDRAGLTNRQVDEELGTVGMAGHYFGGSQWCLPTEDAWDKIVQLAGATPMPTWASLRQEFDSRRQEFDSRRQEFDSRRREFDSRRQEFDSRRREFDIELLSDVWTFDTVSQGDRLGHPTQKPVALLSHIIGTMSRSRDIVLDPFLGTGSTLIACEQLGRICHGVEIDPHYADVICRRFQEFTGEKPILESTGKPYDFGVSA